MTMPEKTGLNEKTDKQTEAGPSTAIPVEKLAVIEVQESKKIVCEDPISYTKTIANALESLNENEMRDGKIQIYF